MSLIPKLPSPLNTIVIENKVGSYKDFGASKGYPLKGVTYHADYGYLPGYIGEDGDGLDFFVGTSTQGLCGYFWVWRSEEVPTEHKFFVCLTDQELADTLVEYEAVQVGKVTMVTSVEELQVTVHGFKDA